MAATEVAAPDATVWWSAGGSVLGSTPKYAGEAHQRAVLPNSIDVLKRHVRLDAVQGEGDGEDVGEGEVEQRTQRGRLPSRQHGGDDLVHSLSRLNQKRGVSGGR